MTAKKLERSKTKNWILILHYFTTELIQVTQCNTRSNLVKPRQLRRNPAKHDQKHVAKRTEITPKQLNRTIW